MASNLQWFNLRFFDFTMVSSEDFSTQYDMHMQTRNTRNDALLRCQPAAATAPARPDDYKQLTSYTVLCH
jgi:hypothetical protein